MVRSFIDILFRHKLARLPIALAIIVLTAPLAHADQLADIRKAGVLRVAVFDTEPPFGFVDAKSRRVVGYDIDFANAIAAKLGVRAQIVATSPVNRIPLLQSGKVDLIVADITITPERAQVIDFTIPYFITGQQFLVPARSSGDLNSYANARIGAVKGTTGEQNVKVRFPKARVLSYDGLPLALAALRSGQVQAITQDGAVLTGILAVSPDAAKYKLLPQAITTEVIGIGVRKNQKPLLNRVNAILVELEASGEASRIYDRWFGKGAKSPQPRRFKIQAPRRP